MGTWEGVLVAIAAAIVVVVVVAAGVVIRAFRRLRRLPANNPRAFLAGHPAPTGRTRVVCLGASTVQGSISFDIVHELAHRLAGNDFINAGINGETSAQVLSRLDDVIACRPDFVIVLIGANDLFAMRETGLARTNVTAATLAQKPTLESFGANLTAIIRQLRQGDDVRPVGTVRVALMSIQPIGERLGSELNRDVERLVGVTRQVAADEGVTYLPLHERLTRLLLASEPGEGKEAGDSPGPIVRAIVLHHGLGITLDRIGQLNGYVLHTDGLHLASPAGRVAADLIEEFVAS